MKMNFRTASHILLITFGCLQFAGYVFKNYLLRGLGISYCVAPLPTVFSTIGGVEGFSTKHSIHFTDDKGKADTIELDRHLFAQFNGHYFLKNAYTIFLTYPHILKPQQTEDAVDFALCGKNIFYRFRIEEKLHNPSIYIQRTRFNKMDTVILIPKCKI